MRLSVIIPTYNRRDILRQTLETVFDQNLPPREYEVIVVVDGSTDGTADMLRTCKPPCGFQVVVQTNRGIAGARNAGGIAARETILLFLDDDLLCDRELCSAHVKAHSGKGALLVFGRTLSVEEGSGKSSVEYINEISRGYGRLDQRAGQPEWPNDAWAGHNCSLPRFVFEQSNGWSEQIPFPHEDFEFGLRLWKQGVPFHYEPKALAYEINHKSTRQRAGKDAYSQGGAEMILTREHPEYRPFSPLSALGRGGTFKRALRTSYLRFLPYASGLTMPALEALDWFSGGSHLRRARLRFYKILHFASLVRGAVAEAGNQHAVMAEFGVRAPVLLYRHVGPPKAGTNPGLTIPAAQFERQMAYLTRKGYTGIRPSEWVDWCLRGKRLPERPVIITFDDAYADIAEHALPALKRYGFGAGVFVVTSLIGGTNIWDETSPGRHSLMTAEQMCYWARQGIEFGAHSRTHPDLTRLTIAALAPEISGSGEDLAKMLGTPTLTFAYPYGLENEPVVEQTRNCFEAAFTTEEGMNYLSTPLCLLRRIEVKPRDTRIEFAWKVATGRNPLKQLRGRIRLRTKVKRIMAQSQDYR